MKFEDTLGREWMETNGIGGFSSGTISGANTRRYHGLLTAAIRPPLGRITMLSKFEEALLVGEERIELTTNQYPGAIYPEGYRYIRDFRLDPFPIWTYEIDGLILEKRLFMPHGLNGVVCVWKLLTGDADVYLEIRPLLSFVDHHHLQSENGEFDGGFTVDGNSICVRPYADMPPLYLSHNASEAAETGCWYRNLEYRIEKERGFDHHEDLFQPFLLRYGLGIPAIAIAATEPMHASDAERLETDEIKRRKGLIKKAKARTSVKKRLVLAADQFIAGRGDGATVMAGYPWFSDWGRDTMISLPGLTLATGRPELAKKIILEYAEHISDGMLPNRFPDGGDKAEYNTVDATLWYFEAIRAYVEATEDRKLLGGGLYEKLAEIVAWHVKGTRYDIHLDTDGLLFAGGPGLQLTWMDAKIGDHVITPRTGKPVEIQALWYNALQTMIEFAEELGHKEDGRRFTAMADLARQNFNASFWNADAGCLFDVVENGTRDPSIRPNQIFAVSLFHPILDRNRWADVVGKVEQELLTPVGLRSLSPADPAYVPRYIGSPFERDSAYHQGTVWAWLIGPFIDAYARVHDEEKGLDKRIREMMEGLIEHMDEAGIGQISEIFDAEPPHNARGCPAQAWSVAEVLRIHSRYLS